MGVSSAIQPVWGRVMLFLYIYAYQQWMSYLLALKRIFFPPTPQSILTIIEAATLSVQNICSTIVHLLGETKPILRVFSSATFPIIFVISRFWTE